MNIETTRRSFLGGVGAIGAAMVIGIRPNGQFAVAAESADTVINPFVRIMPDGSVQVVIKHFEMGQGTTTGLATLVAEELDAAWDNVTTDFAPANTKLYMNLFMKAQGTGGSTAIANSFLQYRKAGAAARDLMVRAAAET